MMPGIFERGTVVRPSQLATVAERRFADSEALAATQRNAHANGAQYLAGFVVEILLKARLIDRYPDVARLRPHERMDDDQRRVWSLIWRSHDLGEMLDRLPELQAAIVKRSQQGGIKYFAELKAICATWNIHARYSTMTSTVAQARDMIERVRKVKELLK